MCKILSGLFIQIQPVLDLLKNTLGFAHRALIDFCDGQRMCSYTHWL